jgi:REP element-mobilizing transposase RayT
MPGTYTKLIYHIIFSTKNREPLVTPGLRENLYPYIGGILRGQDGTLEAIGGMPDHIHLVVRIKPDISVSGMVRLVKANSSKWEGEKVSGTVLRLLRPAPRLHGRFQTQSGYSPVNPGLSTKSTLVDMPRTGRAPMGMPPVRVRKRERQPADKLRQRSILLRPYHQVPMVRHDAVG